MAEVFISYARTDQGFARDLNAALEKVNRDPWMDWRSIPDSAEWRAEIFDAIDAADNFLFIISPDSLRSSMCRQEVARAVAKSKRIVTILYHEVKRRNLFPGLAEIQWINYPELGFKLTFQKLKAAIDADLEWGRKHTQFGLRAAQWEANRRESGYLLHGKELQEATQWLEQVPTIESRQPTALHEKYIRASQAWETGEIQRLTKLTREKDRQRIKAEKAVRVSAARELVASSLQSLEQDPERSILLAMHAIAATWRRDGIAVSEAEAALHEAMQRSFVQNALRIPNARYASVDWGPDGTCLATEIGKDLVGVWNVASGERVTALPADADAITSVAWSPDRKLLAAACRDKINRVWDVTTGSVLRTLRYGPVANWIAWSRDGRRIATTSRDIVCWDATSWKPLWHKHGHYNFAKGGAWSNNSKFLATTGYDDKVKIWGTDTGELLTTIVNHTGRVNSVFWSPDDSRLLVTSSGSNYPSNVASIWNVTMKIAEVCFTLSPQETEITAASWSPDGKQLATGTFLGRVKTWDADTGGEISTLRGLQRIVWIVAWSPESDRVATASADGSVRIWEVRANSELPMLAGHENRIDAVAWSPDSRRLATASRDKTAGIWDAMTGRRVATLSGHKNWVLGVAWSPDGRRIATAGWDKMARVCDAESGKLVMRLKGHAQWVTAVAWSPNGIWIATASGDKTARIWDATTGRQLFSLSGHKEIAGALAWSPDSRLLAIGGLDGAVEVWNAVSGRKLFTLSRGESEIGVIAWSPDGNKLATGGSDRKARIWEVESRRELRVFSGHRDRVTALAWSPDGKYLVFGGGGEITSEVVGTETSVRVWDVATGKERLTFSDHNGVVTSVAWSPDGKRLATASGDGTVRQYAMDVELLLQVARSRVTRNLTPEECGKFLHRDEVPPIP